MIDMIISPEVSIKNALRAIGKAGEKCLIVVDDNNALLGTLSDGDLRKIILSGERLTRSIDGVYNSKPTFFVQGNYDLKDAKKIFLDQKFDLIPIIDSQGKVVDTLCWNDVFKNKNQKMTKRLNVSVVIMAGGKGTRLEPFTKVLPKALVPVHEKSIIEHIIERFTSMGCMDFYLTVNYKARILKAYFEELNPHFSVSFIDEVEPLGTAGSLKFLDGRFTRPFFVTNCDIIIEADYNSLYEFHNKEKNDITLVASTKEYIIPYGTCELDGDGCLLQINEKPKHDFLVNTGLYVLNPDVMQLIPKGKFYHITHLVEDAKNQGKKVGVFPIDDDDWIDVGQWAEYKKAVERL